ncbi:2-oxo-hepta-3-ene-1,7-dioic acid hydratase [uncultured Tateyamaria sp.]|uniref:2-oxo-hepta-3-ene-1,7-dioic acid hydratase n=1 Tax=Tateyamaria sp. 1078 TaxID=3417464 RepID=UPI002618B0C8|nr:2-oxo-hepta-3-ene-1,7-dioic acid hydratase [uncultured Tateyamaria sp.]
MKLEDHRHAAAALVQAERDRTQIGLLSVAYPDIGMDDAYAIQKQVVATKVATGDPVIGWKIGLTSRAMQMALNIDIPDSGVLTRSMRFDSGATIPTGHFIEPRIEAEIAFVMQSDLGGVDATRADVLAATKYVAPALEILDTRILRRDPETGQARKVFDTISDNAANAGIVLGASRNAPDNLPWVGAIVSVGDVVEETGLGAGVLGDPVESVVWLARRMALYGDQIKAGQVILSGSFIRPIECPPGTDIHADFGDFGRVDLSFA